MVLRLIPHAVVTLLLSQPHFTDNHQCKTEFCCGVDWLWSLSPSQWLQVREGMNALWYLCGSRGLHEILTSVMGKTRLLRLQMLIPRLDIQWDVDVDLHYGGCVAVPGCLLVGNIRSLKLHSDCLPQAWELIL